MAPNQRQFSTCLQPNPLWYPEPAFSISSMRQVEAPAMNRYEQICMNRYVQWGTWLLPEDLPRKVEDYSSPPYIHIKSTLCLSVQRAEPAVRPGFISDPNASYLEHSAHCSCPVGWSWLCPAAPELCRCPWLLTLASPRALPAHLSPLCLQRGEGWSGSSCWLMPKGMDCVSHVH